MKLVKCIIRPEKLDNAVEALQSVASGMTVSEVRGHGHQSGHSLVYRGIEYEVALLPKFMIEIVTEDNKVDDIVRVVTKAASTGNIGDGRIFVIPVEAAYNVRTRFMDFD
ncbi:MAG: P-II family nitrogen regulator [Acidobacteria bacterium]|nr:P-II family nitrogen regulator [Acidobacteriota bacterium]